MIFAIAIIFLVVGNLIISQMRSENIIDQLHTLDSQKLLNVTVFADEIFTDKIYEEAELKVLGGHKSATLSIYELRVLGIRCESTLAGGAGAVYISITACSCWQ